MKKLLLITISLLLSTTVMAAMPVNQPIGSSFTLSSAPNQRALTTVFGNPAAPFLMVNEQNNDSFRFGIFGPIGVGYEVGSVSDLIDRARELETFLVAEYADLTQVKEALVDANAIITDIGKELYLKSSVSLQVPLMPIIYKTKNKGAFMLDASIFATGKGSLLTNGVDINVDEFKLSSDASIYAQTIKDFNFGLSYSQAILKNTHGLLIGGVKANLHQISLKHALFSLSDTTINATDSVNTILDDVVSSSNVGIDLGAIWVSYYYQTGITFANINEAKFDRNVIDDSCPTESCIAASALSSSDPSLLSLSDAYKMKMQTTLDFAISTRSKQLTLGMSYDVNAVKDAVGDKHQWAVASLSYYGDSHFLPGLRFGLRQNMAGTKLSYSTAGLTFFKRLNLDLAVALETVKDSAGNGIPRSAYLSLGYDTAF